MIPSLPVLGAAAAIVASMSFGAAWQIQDWRADAHEKQHVEQHAAEERELFVLEQKRQSVLAAAQLDAANNETRLRDLLARSRNTSKRVQSAADTAVDRARSGHDACLVTAVTLRAVFGECREELVTLGEKASRHVIDIKKIERYLAK